MNAYDKADAAIKAYESFVFASVGRSVADFAFRADMLAASAVEALEIAVREAKIAAQPEWYVSELKKAIVEFRNIAGSLA